TLEVYAPAAGTLVEVLAEEGTNVPVGAVLGRIAAGVAPAQVPHPPIADATGPSLSRTAGEGAERSEAGEGIAAALERSGPAVRKLIEEGGLERGKNAP